MSKKHILVKGIDSEIWKQARLAALNRGETMGEFVASALKLRLEHETMEQVNVVNEQGLRNGHSSFLSDLKLVSGENHVARK